MLQERKIFSSEGFYCLGENLGMASVIGDYRRSVTDQQHSLHLRSTDYWAGENCNVAHSSRGRPALPSTLCFGS